MKPSLDESYRERKTFRVAIRGILFVQHVVEGRDLAVRVRDLGTHSTFLRRVSCYPRTHNRESDCRRGKLATPFLDILRPLLMVLQSVRRDANDLHTALREVRRPIAQLPTVFFCLIRGRTHRRATSASSVVHTGVKSPGWEKRTACET